MEPVLAKPLLLARHPDTPSAPMTLPVWIGLTGGMLRVTFRIPADTSPFLFPARVDSAFETGLWEHSCFEAFVMPVGGTEYVELNFSPSTRWAAFHFDRYREGMRPIAVGAPKLVATPRRNRFELSAGVLLPDWPGLAWRVNLAAVIEEKSGRKSHWALAHPPGAPDFHHPDCFVLELPAPDAP